MNATESMVRSFAERHPEEAARTLEANEPAEAAKVLKKLPEKLAGRVTERLAVHAIGPILSHLEPSYVRHLLTDISPRQAVAILQTLEEAAREETLRHLPEESAGKLRPLLNYPPETAASMMDTRITTIPVDATVAAAIKLLKKAKRETLYYLYVTERDGKLAGLLTLRDLMLAASKDKIEPMVRREVTTVAAQMDREEVAHVMRQKRYLALPVVDADGRMLGVIKSDEVLKAAQEEAFEDVQKLVGAGGDERALSPVSTVVKKRLGWLLVNLGTAFLAAAVVGIFEETIAAITALAVLLPIVAGQGGNTGAQALAVVMRGIALREILPGTVKRLILKEFLGGFFNGLAIAVATATAVYLWDGRLALAAVIGMAMVVNMAMAALAGTIIPLILKALNKDPAQSSSIFMTTVTDIVGFASFLGFASLFRDHLT